jgi:hypothetical protein
VIVPLNRSGPLQVKFTMPVKLPEVTVLVEVKLKVKSCPAPVIEPVKLPE